MLVGVRDDVFEEAFELLIAVHLRAKVGELLPGFNQLSKRFDLLNADGQEIASGLYLFSVRDETTGETQQGKFMVIR